MKINCSSEREICNTVDTLPAYFIRLLTCKQHPKCAVNIVKTRITKISNEKVSKMLLIALFELISVNQVKHTVCLIAILTSPSSTKNMQSAESPCTFNNKCYQLHNNNNTISQLNTFISIRKYIYILRCFFIYA